MVGTADSVLIRELSRGLYGEVPQYIYTNMKPYKKTISENNIGAPWAPLYCYIYAQSLNLVTKVTVQSLEPVSTLRNNCKVTVD